MRPNGILIIAALLLGVAGGYLLRGETGPHSPPPADTPYREHEPTVPTAEPEMLAQDPAPAPTQPTLESVHGDGVIRGRIADKSGAGVPGVAVVATPLVRGRAGAPNPTRAAPARTSLEADLADAAESVRARHAGRQRVLSDEFGAYIVKHLGPGAYRIVAWKEHYQIRPARGSPAWEAKAGVVVDFEADAILVAYLDVTGADGRTPERANISSSTDAEGHKGRRRFLWTPEQNWVQLSPGEHWLVADAHDGEEESAPAHVTLLPGEPAPRATLELIGRPGIRGRVILPEPLEMFHPEVAAIRFEGETPPDANEAMQSRGRNSGNFDRRDNTYSLKEMEAGRYLLMVSFDGRSVEHSVVVDVGNSVLVQDLELPPIDRTRYRVVRVLGENGMAISGVQFSLSVRSKGGGLSAGASTVQRADGSYYVSRRPSISDESHREMIEASDAITHLRVLVRDRGSIVRQVSPTEEGELVLRFGAPAGVDLVIGGYAQSELSGKCVLYVKQELRDAGMSFSGGGVPISAEGRASIDKLQAGRSYALLLYKSDSAWIQVEAWPLELRGGRNQESVILPPLHEVTLEGSLGYGVTLTRSESDRSWVHQRVRAVEGRGHVARFVPPGHYVATTRNKKRQEKRVEFDVPTRGPVSFPE